MFKPTALARSLAGFPALSSLLVAAAMAAAAPPAPAQVRLPALGESASDEFNLNVEKRIGDQVMRDIRRDPDYLDDPVLLAYVQGLWDPLVAAARERGDITPDIDRLFAFECFLVRDRSVNAFALPGGYVGVHAGLVALTATRDELASVLGHELSHVTQRHIARSVSAQSRASTVSIAAMLLGMIAAGRSGNLDMAQAAIMGGQAAAIQQQLNFSRDMEREADRNGFALLERAGFAVGGMSAMFDKLDGANRLNDSGLYPYLRSHPLTVERIAEARARAQSAASVPPTIEHALMQARARVLMDPAVPAQRRSQAQDGLLATQPWMERLAGFYASALASVQLREFERAEAALQRARGLLDAGPRLDPRAQRAFALLAAQVALAKGDGATAQARLAPLAAERTRELLLLRAQVAVTLGEEAALREATEALQVRVAEHRDDAGAWALLAQTADRLGLKLRALRAEAESRAALGDSQGAIDRLRAGQRLVQQQRSGATPADFIEASVIDARLRELTAQRRQLAAELRGERGGPRPEGE